MRRTDVRPRSSWQSNWRGAAGRIAVTAVTLGALSTFALAPSIATAATGQGTASVISIADNAKLGPILVSGTTVYTLKPSKTACTAACLKAWPAVLLPAGVMAATAGSGVDASKLGTVPAAGGALEVTYAGKPLHWFVKDKAPGQAKGNITTKWGKWHTVAVTTSSSGSGSSSGTSSGSSSGSNTTEPAPTTSKPNPGTGGSGF